MPVVSNEMSVRVPQPVQEEETDVPVVDVLDTFSSDSEDEMEVSVTAVKRMSYKEALTG